MDDKSWEFNKIAGATIAALLVAFGSGTVADIIQGGHGDKKAKPGYELPVTAPTAGGKAETAKPFDAAAVVAQVKSASAENGAAVFKPCVACHTPQKGGKPGTGPNLFDIVGKPVGANAEFPRYSAALKAAGGNWTFERLATYLHDPRGAIPGNQMAFAGVKSNDDLADLLAYLRSLSDKPAPLP